MRELIGRKTDCRSGQHNRLKLPASRKVSFARYRWLLSASAQLTQGPFSQGSLPLCHKPEGSPTTHKSLSTSLSLVYISLQPPLLVPFHFDSNNNPQTIQTFYKLHLQPSTNTCHQHLLNNSTSTSTKMGGCGNSSCSCASCGCAPGSCTCGVSIPF